MKDRFNLERFVTTQNQTFDIVRSELMQGHKRGHWMWFVFPQLKGLGRSAMADYYAISSYAEAKAYLEHPVLGQRLIECTDLVNRVEGRSTQEIFGEIDFMKFRSSMTLFAEVDRSTGVFMKALERYFGGQKDQLTLNLLEQWRRV